MAIVYGEAIAFALCSRPRSIFSALAFSPAAAQACASATAGARIVRRLHGLPIFRDRFLELACAFVPSAEIVVLRRILWIQDQAPLAGFNQAGHNPAVAKYAY